MANYSDKVFELALKELKTRKKTAEATYKMRRAEMFRISPEIKSICEQLEVTGTEFFGIMTDKEQDKDKRIEELKYKNLALQDQLAVLLKAFRDDSTYLDIPYTCKKCEDTGYRDSIRCECYEQLLKTYAAKELTDNCGIELNDFSDFRLDIYPERDSNGADLRGIMREYLEYCREYAEKFDTNMPSLLLTGMTGTGKTFMSSCIAKAVTEKGYSVVFGSVSTYLRRLEDEHFGRRAGDTFDVLSRCDLLILDDLGSEFKTQFTESALYDIINSRINLRKPTIISTNLSSSEMNAAYNERIVSRLTGCFDPLKFRGKDLRHILRKY